MKKHCIALLFGMACASLALAQVSVTAPWIRATVPQAKGTGAFMQLRSVQDARLVGVRSEVAGVVEIHKMEMNGQMMRMHPVSGIDLPAGQTVNLASGGYHVMLMDLKRQLKEGDSVPLVLQIEQKGKPPETLTVSVPVKPLTYMPAASAQH